ncbi:MAG: GNAT family N-acetyltransferase [Deltaproteobacteria bacterium]|nr:GNAT family N-acetyltransferase [Deltaproteobacteria bacterium]
MNVRAVRKADLERAGEVLFEAMGRDARVGLVTCPWSSPREAQDLVAHYLAEEPDGAACLEQNGRLMGVGFARRRGEIVVLGPIAAAEPGKGIGSAILSELISTADGWGSASIRLHLDARNPSVLALFAGKGFSVVDSAARVERPIAAPPRLDAARGLEITPFRPQDIGELMVLDARLTGLERPGDISQVVRLVARRRGSIAGYLGAAGGLLGPALALDVADLGALVARALVDCKETAVARMSMAAPTLPLALLALGFRMVGLGLVMSRGVMPPARPPQLYCMFPEVL